MRRFCLSSLSAALCLVPAFHGCIDPIPAEGGDVVGGDAVPAPTLAEIAGLLAELPLEYEHLKEVHDAVSSSSENGYDEEYTMSDLFAAPGSGVGDARLPSKSPGKYENPVSALIRNHLEAKSATRSVPGQPALSSGIGADDYVEALASSDIQIYWPFSETWNGTDVLPVITFDPENDASVNTGYRMTRLDDGSVKIDTVAVDEKMAMEHPVWVVNRNSDSGYLSLDMVRQLYPDRLEGGNVIVGPSTETRTAAGGAPGMKTLVLKDFIMNRNYDSWFAGASEFFVKCGSVENFTASTEAELQLYSPAITDFMIVVKRNQVGKAQPFNAVLVSDLTDQVENLAFMIIEDDGGKRTSWKCTALVRIASKSYGVEIELPFNTRDDIVWRGSLSSRYLAAHSNIPENFGDVVITFEMEEY